MFYKSFSIIDTKIKQRIPFERGNFHDYFNKKDEKGKFLINPAKSSLFLPPPSATPPPPPLFLEKLRKQLGAWMWRNQMVLIQYLFLFWKVIFLCLVV